MEPVSTEQDMDRLFGEYDWRVGEMTWDIFGGCTQKVLDRLMENWFDNPMKQARLQNLWDRHPRRQRGIIVALISLSSTCVIFCCLLFVSDLQLLLFLRQKVSKKVRLILFDGLGCDC
jgi:hypothetical protein